MVQKERQPFSEFLTELRAQIERCEFNCTCGLSYESRMLRDRIITGVYDKKLQLKLLDGRDETLDRVVDICKTFESANVHKGILASKQSIAAIALSENTDTDSVDAINMGKKRTCFNCGGDWDREHKSKCPAKNFTCQCGKKGHFRRMCRSKGKKSEVSSSGRSQSKSNDKSAVDSLRWNDVSSSE
ncbi:uncharacterized protein LOC129572650 [Sitodiplosis mosellana]|uniref:uncharacterized protein LOC129572650 n=1 Tax=Sitodiplosis mosellana TaxID=263140 RepID=UPI0024450F6F|nr:uncharacterized protein LOC129572650 [Sitodiplosis mosellana]